MVNPADAAGSMLGIDTEATGAEGMKAEFGRLFSSILFVAGRDGCACRTCKLGEQLAMKLVEQAEAPFPAAVDRPEPAQPPAAPAAPPVDTTPAPYSPPAAPPPPAVNSEAPSA